MTPNKFMYLDYYQSEDRSGEPLGIGGFLPIEKVYSFEPYTEDMTEEEKSHILGVQANLWTEYIGENWHLGYMLLPRMSALSEVQWCQSEAKDYERFLENLKSMLRIYDALGYNYRPLDAE
jgi:hexosaminidase